MIDVSLVNCFSSQITIKRVTYVKWLVIFTDIDNLIPIHYLDKDERNLHGRFVIELKRFRSNLNCFINYINLEHNFEFCFIPDLNLLINKLE